eukprot:2423608-Rhodomonas_salina.2
MALAVALSPLICLFASLIASIREKDAYQAQRNGPFPVRNGRLPLALKLYEYPWTLICDQKIQDT